jgi:MFS family permease
MTADAPAAASGARALWLPVLSLFAGTGILLVGIGLFFTALGLRAGLADFSTAATGLVMSAYFVGFVAGTYICPALIRRVGHIRAFAAMASIASTTAIVHAMIVDPWVWGLLRFATGVCLVGLYIVIESWLNTVAPNRYRGRIFSAYVALTLVAMGLGQFLVLAGDVLGFVPLGLVSILLSLALVPVALTRTREPQPVDAPHLGLRHLYEVSGIATVGAFASGMLNGAFYGLGAVFAQRIGLSEAATAAFVAATIFGGALLQWPLGHWSDRQDRRRVLLAACAGAALLAVAARLAVDFAPALLIVAAFFYGGLVFSVYGLSVALVNDRLHADQVLEATSGLLLLHGLGAALGPTLAGLVMSVFAPGALLAYFAAVLAAVLAYGLWRGRETEVPAEKSPFMPMASSSHAVLALDPRAHEAAPEHEEPDDR